MPSPLTASIVINTHNRALCLERLLPSLSHLQGVDFEVVVVNGPSTDHTDEVLAAYAGRLKVARCPVPNLSLSRNIGIAAAAGDIIAFIDDDAIPAEKTWLADLARVFEEDTAGRIGAVGGPALHLDSEHAQFRGGWTSDYAEQLFHGQPLRADEDASRWYRRTIGCNTAFRRTALVDVGGFDERFVYYLDESDLCLRLARHGYATVSIEHGSVRHYPAPSVHGSSALRSRRLVARSDTYYCLKNGADPLPLRLLKTLRLAPTKHFVRELRDMVRDGRITSRDLWSLRARWLQGVGEGLVLGLFGSRANRLDANEPPPWVPFPSACSSAALSVCLLSRHLSPDPHAGGIGRYTWDLARGLHELGHRVTILTESDAAIRYHGLGFTIIGVRPPVTPSALQATPILAKNLAYASAVLDRLDELARQGHVYDVVHATNWGIDALGVAQAGRWPLTLMLVTPLESVMAAEGWSENQDLSANIALDQWLVAQATRVCAPSSGVLDTYRHRARWNDRTVHPVPLGIVPAWAASRARTVAGTSRRLLFVGRLERRKGIDTLLDVLPALLARHPSWRCDLVGNKAVPAGPGVTFESLFHERHVDAAWMERITFHGAVSDDRLHEFYQQADLFVAPSLFESFGLIYLEAMQYGVPVVGCRVGGVPEVVAHDRTGVLVPPADAPSLEAALDRLMSDDALRLHLGDRAAADVQARFSHTALAGRMVTEYRAAIAAHQRGDEAGRADDSDRNVPGQHPVITAALATLASHVALGDVGFGLSAAQAAGGREAAADYVTRLLAVTPHPAHYAMALELALIERDDSRARDLARQGLTYAAESSEHETVFAAALIRTRTAAADDPAELRTWRAKQGERLSRRLLDTAVTAIRTGRDGTAIMLLEACEANAGRDQGLLAQTWYHLGSALKRQGRPSEARRVLERAMADGHDALLPVPFRSAAHFHLGELCLHDGEPLAAARHFDLCLTLNPGHQRARALRAELKVSAGTAA